MKKLLSYISRREVVYAVGLVVAGITALQDALVDGANWSTALRAAIIAAGAVIARANVFSKATVEG